MRASMTDWEGNASPPSADQNAPSRTAAGGAALFLCGMITILLSWFFIHDEIDVPPVVASGALSFFFLWTQIAKKGSLWPAPAGIAAGFFAIGFNITDPGALPDEAYGPMLRLRGTVHDRVDRRDSVVLELTRLECPDQGWASDAWIRLTGKVESIGPVVPGDRIEAVVRLRRPEGHQAPGVLDYGKWLRRHGHVATGWVGKTPVSTIAWDGGAYWNRQRNKISHWIMERLPAVSEGLAEGLLVGKRGLVGTELNEALQVTGTYHLLAISGQHLSMVAGWSFLVLRWLLTFIIPASRRWDMKKIAAILSFPPLLVYSQLAGWSVSTQRATLATGLVLLGFLVWRRSLGVNTMILSAILILFFWPEELFGAGFHLTYVAVVALLFFFHSIPYGGTYRRRMFWMAALTLFMSLATAPIVAYHFHRFAPYGFPANLFAIPWIGFVSLPLGFAALATQPILPWLSNWLLDGMGLSLEVFVLWIEGLSRLPHAWQRLPGPSLWGISLSLALLAACFILPWKRGRSGLAALAALALFWPRGTPPPGRLHVACLDVGQAMAAVVRGPDNEWMVIDAGGVDTPRFNVGEGVISPYLWHHGVHSLARIVISHPEQDHMAGALALLRNFHVRELWLGFFPEQETNRIFYRRIIRYAENHGVKLHRIDSALERKSLMTVNAVSPRVTGTGTEVNDRSLIVTITLGQQRFLFPGDIEARGERWFLDQDPAVPFTVVVAPHHGSITSSSQRFVTTLAAQHVVFSSDASRNRNIPHPRVLDRWQRSGARPWRTDTAGTIIWEADGEQLWFQPPDRGG
ncbi:MAG: DNA internalization-related competence protein ComEC/Rec2 [Magnetococcales bacterium]|nr:DNA internalization-related competence protein ComEC/Rec2 [Magnetococcales bacterium]